MPQLDKLNWFLILLLLICFLAIFLVIFIKRIFYSWRKIVLLKNLINFQNSRFLNFKNLFSFLTINTFFFNIRKLLFQKLLLSKTTFFSNAIKDFEKNISLKK